MNPYAQEGRSGLGSVPKHISVPSKLDIPWKKFLCTMLTVSLLKHSWYHRPHFSPHLISQGSSVIWEAHISPNCPTGFL